MSINDREKRRQYMLTAPLFPLIVRTAVPTMAGMMVMMIYNLTDTFWIGMLKDTAMTAAVGIVFAFVSLVQAFGFWFGYGSGNIMSRKLGEHLDEDAEIYADTGIVLALICSFLIIVPGMVMCEKLAVLLGANQSQQLLDYTVSYLKTMLLAVPFALFSTTVYNQLRLCGNVKDAMLGMLTGILGNIVLDPLFILVFHMGIVGAGAATLAGQVGSCAALYLISKKHGNIPAGIRRARPDREHIYHILAGGSPNFTRQGITSLASVLLNMTAARYGEEMIAAVTVSSRVAAIGYMLAIGFGQGFQPVCAMNYGAKQYRRVMRAFLYTMAAGTCMMLVFTAVYALYAPEMISLFASDRQVIEAGSRMLHYQCFAMPFLGVYAYTSMYLQNTGHYFRALTVSVMRQGIIYIPLLMILPHLFGITGIFLLQPVSDILSAVSAVIILFSYWKQVPEEVCFRS